MYKLVVPNHPCTHSPPSRVFFCHVKIRCSLDSYCWFKSFEKLAVASASQIKIILGKNIILMPYLLHYCNAAGYLNWAECSGKEVLFFLLFLFSFGKKGKAKKSSKSKSNRGAVQSDFFTVICPAITVFSTKSRKHH